MNRARTIAGALTLVLSVAAAAHAEPPGAGDEGKPGHDGKAEGARHEARKKLREAGKQAKEARQEMRAAAKEAREEIREARKEAHAEMKEAREGAREDLKEAREDLREAKADVREAAKQAGADAEAAIAKAKAAVEDAKKRIMEARSSAHGEVKQKLREMRQKLRTAAEAVRRMDAPKVDDELTMERRRLARWVMWHTMARRPDAPRAMPPPARAELKTHARRQARLWRVRQLAEDKGDTAAVERVDKLLAREQERHDRRISMIFSGPPAAEGKGPDAPRGQAPPGQDKPGAAPAAPPGQVVAAEKKPAAAPAAPAADEGGE